MKKIISIILAISLLLISSVPAISAFSLFDIDKTADTNEYSRNLIVLENTNFYNANRGLDEHIYICCRTEADEEATLCAEMELFGMSDFGNDLYRFTYPEGVDYFYFTDGKIRTEETYISIFESSVYLYLPDTFGENGSYDVYSDTWCGGTNPYFEMGPSDTTFDRFVKVYVPESESFYDHFDLYEELYAHRDQDGKADRTLIHINSKDQDSKAFEDIIGNRLVRNPGSSYPFASGYCIYDAEKDAFVPVDGDTIDDYDDLDKAFDEVGSGRLFGDLDRDDHLTIFDVTILQRCDVNICDYPTDDEIDGSYRDVRYYSDFNRDGVRDLIDATALQRYLVNIPYSVG